MLYFFSRWEELKEKLENKHLFIFLDYDGTLAKIANLPHEANISKKMKQLLKKLSEISTCKIAIISGRSLKDIKEKVGIKNIIYSGNHGLEIEGPKIKFYSPVSIAYKNILEKLKGDLQKELLKIKGVIFENKGPSLSVHYRLVHKSFSRKVKTIFHNTIILPLIKKQVKIQYGKKVMEIRPPTQWDKGRVILWLLNRYKFFLKNKSIVPIYIGDDATDEDAFKALQHKGLTIFVGRPRDSYARYYLKNTDEVFELLKNLLTIKRNI